VWNLLALLRDPLPRTSLTAPRSLALAIVLVLITSGCDRASNPDEPRLDASGGGTEAGDVDLADGGLDADPDPVFTPDAWSTLQALSPDALPAPPPDPTNRFADAAAAAALGQQLFFDPSFSGQLLDTDNQGPPQALGVATATSGETGKVACAGCHLPASGFSDTRSFQLQISLGAGWGRRRAPSLLDVGQATLIMWDGRKDSLFSQIFGPLETVVEMNSSRLYMAEQLYKLYQSDYEAVFGPMPPLGDATQFPPLAADVTGCIPSNRTDPSPTCDGPFHGMPGDGAEFDGMTPANQTAVTTVVANAGKAIGAYERLLSCGESPFDAWMHGDATAVSRAVQRGAAVFVGKGNCVTCHSGPFMSDQKFHNVGLAPTVVQQAFVDSDDQGEATGLPQLLASPLNSAGTYSDGTDGRIPAAVTSAMAGAFRTPMMRCVGMRPTFMHTGQLGTLAAVVTFFNQGGDPANRYPGTSELSPLGLSALDESDLVAFLQALTGPGAPPALQASTK
jgi:cytochrome c peroxidase